jgi:hypothetical protein
MLREQVIIPHFFMNRIHTYKLDPISKQKELNTVKQIINNNKYVAAAATEPSRKKKQDQHHKETQNTNGPDSHT